VSCNRDSNRNGNNRFADRRIADLEARIADPQQSSSGIRIRRSG
jgi:hypothetical protein